MGIVYDQLAPKIAALLPDHEAIDKDTISKDVLDVVTPLLADRDKQIADLQQANADMLKGLNDTLDKLNGTSSGGMVNVGDAIRTATDAANAANASSAGTDASAGASGAAAAPAGTETGLTSDGLSNTVPGGTSTGGLAGDASSNAAGAGTNGQ